MQITDRVFVVTGGGNGIGRQIALEIVRRGGRVAIADRDAERLEETRSLASRSEAVSLHVLDVTDEQLVQALPDEVITAQGKIDGIVNVAGIIHRFVPMSELSAGEMRAIMEVNFWGTVNTTLALVPLLRKRPEASIVNISSLSALVAFSGQGFYGATKGAVKQFSEALYQELLNTNVAVTTVFPGNISTNISGNSGVAMLDAGGRKVPATTPERTAQLIVDGITRGSFRVIIGNDARLLDGLSRTAPARAAKLVAAQMKSVL
jgi:short-subunit dehydrogenase